jgi:hypothetical protein
LFDACANGQQLKSLAVLDEFSRGCLAIDVAGSIRSGRVIEFLAQLISVHGAPRYLRTDITPEFAASRDLDLRPTVAFSLDIFCGECNSQCPAVESSCSQLSRACECTWRSSGDSVKSRARG